MIDFSSVPLALVAAATAFAVSVITALITALVMLGNAERRLRQDIRLDFAAERAVRSLMRRRAYRVVPFEALKYHFAGFADNQLRQILVRAGAVQVKTPADAEFWGLLERNRRVVQGR